MNSECKSTEIICTLCSLEIDCELIAEKLHRLVAEDKLNQSEIIEYIVQRSPHEERLHSILTYFCSIEDVHLSKKRKKPRPVSASDWSNIELNYYNIVFTDVPPEVITHVTSLSNKATNFIRDNKHLTHLTFAKRDDDTQNLTKIVSTDFQRTMLLISINPSRESCVDTMFMCFMKSVLDDDFHVQIKYDMKLFVSNVERKATADLVAILFPQFYVGVIVVEDKPQDHRKNVEAQIIAEGIAIAQQKKWPLKMPVFMIRVIGIYVSVYKAVFTNEFISSVKNGTKRNIPFKVLRYSKDPAFEGQTPGCSLLNPNQRELLAKILCGICKEIKSCASNE